MRKTVTERIFRAILYGRFEPIETAMAVWSFISGVFILAPWNDEVMAQTNKFLVYDNFYLYKAVGVITVLLGVLHLFFMARSDSLRKNLCYRLRANTLFGITLVILFTTMEVYLEVGIQHPRWLTYLTLAVVSAISYLSLVIKR